LTLQIKFFGLIWVDWFLVKSKVRKVILVVCLVKSGGSSTAFHFSDINITQYYLDRFTRIQGIKTQGNWFNLPGFLLYILFIQIFFRKAINQLLT